MLTVVIAHFIIVILILFNSFHPKSSRSRVRGHLELYHAYLQDDSPLGLSGVDEGRERDSETDSWDIVEHPGINSVSQVSILTP